MAKITLPSVASGYNVSTINANFQALAAELNNKVLYRANPVGEANQVTTDVDMNSKRLLNLPAPTSDLEPLRRIDAADIGTQSAAAIAAADAAEASALAAQGYAVTAGANAVDSGSSAVLAGTAKDAALDAAALAQGYADDAYDNSRLTIGTVVTAPAGGSAAATINGVPGSQVLSLTIPRGDQGIQGPVGPAGPSGSGSGDVIGPASSVVDHVAVFNSTDGKVVKSAGVPLSSKQDTLGFTPENVTNKGAVNGYAPLGADQKVPLANLPTITAAEIITPSNVSPSEASTNVVENPTLTGSTFYSNYSATHANTQVQVHTTNVFTSPLYSSGDVTGSTSFTLPLGILSVGTQYFWRIRYKNSRGTYSDWSTPTSFTTSATFNNYIPTPAATPAIGASFEGGYYTGLIWNELVQSSTSTTIGTGSQTFTVPSMSSTPIVYAGQTLQIRSRANPDNKMTGVVTAAVGTALTINVTSVAGSGTFTDWSIMAQYRVILAPKASGESSTQLTSATAVLSFLARPSEGYKMTQAMLAAGNSTAYPAAYAAAALSVGGKTDWYVPSRDEFELAWRNLKPITNSNDTSARVQILGSLSEAAYPDATGYFFSGANRNATPVGEPYTTSVPGQTSVALFQTGGAEAFNAVQYSTATEYDASNRYVQDFSTSQPGRQFQNPKTAGIAWRAVRRSII